MGSEEAEAVEPKTGLFSVSPKMMKSASGMLTPPLQGCSAAVPFGWEEEPGKPRPCTALVITAAQLELPPRLAKQQPSPTTSLLGCPKRPKAASFRLTTTTSQRSSGHGSFHFSPSPSPERSSARLGVGAIGLSKRWSKEKGWLFGAWRARRKSEFKGKARSEVAAGDSFVFPSESLTDDDQDKPLEEYQWIKTRSHFWATIYGGLKQVIPWKAKKLKKAWFVN